MSKDTSFETRYEGYDIVDYGLATIPNLLFKHYRNLGLSDGHFTLLSHIISRKWTDAPPYPTITHIPMSATVDTRRRYVREMRNQGLIFTARLYWTHKDAEENPKAKPGKLRANLWYLGNLFHNLERMEQWTADGNKPEDFVIEIQQATVELYLAGKLNDVPDKIAKIIDEQTSVVDRAIPVLVRWLPEELVCENHTVDINDDLLCENLVVENLVVENHIVMKKNHDSNKNQDIKEEETTESVKTKQPQLLNPQDTLDSDTSECHLLFEKLAVEYKAKGRRAPKKFPTLACKRKFLQAADKLNGTLEKAIGVGLENNIIKIPNLVNYISSPKWQNGGKKDGYGSNPPKNQKPQADPASRLSERQLATLRKH